MFVILYGLLLGILFSLILCAPYTYYFLLISLFAVSVVVYMISFKIFKKPEKKHYLCAVLVFIISYSICTYTVFRQGDSINIMPSKQKSDKTAVIFYCEGEMEKYSPYYVKPFIENKPLLLKPFYAYNIKKIYRGLGVNSKNEQLAKVADEVRNSILNYKPYLFYIALSNYVPNARDSINSAVSDGCSEILVINYTSKKSIEDEISSNINLTELRNSGIKIEFSPSVMTTETFTDYMTSRIVNLPSKSEGILLIGDENDTTAAIKNKLKSSGFPENQIIISKDIESSINYFKGNNIKNLLYVNLEDSSSGLNGEVYIPGYFEKYCSDIKITGIKDWGYDKKLIKACIEVFLKTSGS